MRTCLTTGGGGVVRVAAGLGAARSAASGFKWVWPADRGVAGLTGIEKSGTGGRGVGTICGLRGVMRWPANRNGSPWLFLSASLMI